MRFEVVLARRVIGKTYEFRVAFLRDVNVMGGIGSAHIERRGCALGALHPEPGEKLLHDVEIGRAQAAVCHIGDLDQGHDRFSPIYARYPGDVTPDSTP